MGLLNIGIRAKQERLYKEHYGRLYGLCMRYTRNPSDAQDTLHDAFIKIFKHTEKIDIQQNPGSYLYGTVKNHIIDEFRKKKHIVYSRDDLADIIEDEEDTTQEDFDDNIHNIIKALQDLSPVERFIFNMKAIDGYKLIEIADITKMPMGTVKVCYWRAKNKLIKKLTLKKS